MDFKAQIAKDMAVFNNTSEFATVTNLWYEGEQYTVPVIFDHEAAVERQKPDADKASTVWKCWPILLSVIWGLYLREIENWKLRWQAL